MSYVEKSFTINGYDVHAKYEKTCVETLLRPLLHHLRSLQKEKKGRILVYLVAPPGVGKTTLSMFLEDLSRDGQGEELQAIGMDGFHRYQAYLASHKMRRNGEEVSMVTLKGSPETFDDEKLRQKIIQLTKEENVMWPLYVRSIHNPVEDQIKVTKNIVVLEGNYLLLKDKDWRDLKQYCDYSIFISTKLQYIEERLIARKMMGGTSREDAYLFYKNSDAYNAQYILTHSQKADLMCEMSEDGSYHSVND